MTNLIRHIISSIILCIVGLFAYVFGLTISSTFAQVADEQSAQVADEQTKDGGYDNRKNDCKNSRPKKNKLLKDLPRHSQGEIKDLKEYPRSKSETRAIRILERVVGDKFPACNPPWLCMNGKPLELDGFNGQIAFEFSGPLHTKWFPNMEPYYKYFSRIKKDKFKVDKCEEMGIPFIVLDISLPETHWQNYILSRLYDYGLVERPIVYIDKQTAEVYRNEQIEREEYLV